MRVRVLGVVLCTIAFASCQSSGASSVTSGLETAELKVADGSATLDDPNAVPQDQAEASSDPAVAARQDPATQLASAAPQPAPSAAPVVAQCAQVLAEGPPPVPARGADFGKAVAKDVGKNVSRNLISMIGGAVGGQIGSAVAGGTAQATIRAEGDIKGTWTVTDGAPNCGCAVEIGGLFKLQGKGTDSGTAKPQGCANPALAQVAHWNLGYSFTGYDAKFELKAKDKKTVLATLNREGVHYFQGSLADGTPIVLWRDKQNYNAFKN
ncbi:MAG: hypothetical protein WBO55_15430 [Rhizobiaceae bacterium]